MIYIKLIRKYNDDILIDYTDLFCVYQYNCKYGTKKIYKSVYFYIFSKWLFAKIN